MSNHEGPSRRRRIAGESKPSDARVPGAAKKVVRRPVARPGAPVPPPADEPRTIEAATPEVEDAAAAPPEVEEAQEADVDDTVVAAPAPRVAPRVGRRPRPAADETPADAPPAGEPSAEDASNDAPAGAAATRTRRRPPLGRVVLVAATLAALALGAVLGTRGFLEWRETHGVEGAHQQAAEAAATAAETIFTYRYDQLETYLEDSQDLMTPSFAQDFETISPALSDLAPQRQIQVEATTRDSAPLGCGDDCRRDEAQVLVFVDQARLADGTEVPTVFGNRVRFDMVERDGRWLVDDITAL